MATRPHRPSNLLGRRFQGENTHGNEEKGSEEGSQEEKALTKPGEAQASLNFCRSKARPPRLRSRRSFCCAALRAASQGGCLQGWFVLEESLTLSGESRNGRGGGREALDDVMGKKKARKAGDHRRPGDPRQAVFPDRRSCETVQASGVRAALLGERVPAVEAGEEQHRPAHVPAARRRERAAHQEAAVRRRLHHRRRPAATQGREQAGEDAVRVAVPQAGPRRRPQESAPGAAGNPR